MKPETVLGTKYGEEPKEKLQEAAHIIKQISVEAPIEIGDIIIHDIADTKVDVIATRRVRKKA